MGKRKKRKSNVGTIIMIIVIVLLSLFVYLLATKRIDFNNKNDDLVEDNTNIDNNKLNGNTAPNRYNLIKLFSLMLGNTFLQTSIIIAIPP